MPTDHIVSLIDQEIAQLQQARAALAGLGSTANAPAKHPGRPRGSTNKTTETNAPAKRTMSAEGKARIAAAQKARWAAQKQAEEPATRKYAVKLKAARKTVAKAKKTAPPKAPPATEAATPDVLRARDPSIFHRSGTSTHPRGEDVAPRRAATQASLEAGREVERAHRGTRPSRDYGATTDALERDSRR